MIIAGGEPGRRTVGLSGDQYAVVQFLPADIAPKAAARLGISVVADLEGELLAGPKRGGCRRQDEVFGLWLNFCSFLPSS